MTDWQITLALAIGAMATGMLYTISREIERHLGRIANAVLRVAEQNERIGNKLDNLWSPISGINSAMWKRPGDRGDWLDDRAGETDHPADD